MLHYFTSETLTINQEILSRYIINNKAISVIIFSKIISTYVLKLIVFLINNIYYHYKQVKSHLGTRKTVEYKS